MTQKKMSGAEIRKKFLEFFKNKHNHLIYPSSSLIPDNPTVLLTTAGMAQFIPIFLGYEKPPTPPRVATVQKCARAGGKDSDIENVGRTPRHHTFFEMLGNFSFGDYFKEEVIPWAWDFITNELGIDKSRLWITIYETDDESFKIWRDKVGVPEERIIRKGKKDNFWGPVGVSGSCGPCSEIHYDLGEQYACGDNCSIATCECDRYVEIWNLVFTELFQDEEGNHTPLAHKNIDTGMGLERITMVMNGVASTFETDLLRPILDAVCKMAGKTYKANEKDDISLRIITDHVRCVSFMIADGITPGNEGRSYVLRMIMRRALRHGKMLGLELPFLHKLVDVVVDNYKEAYPELGENRDKIISTIKNEEEKFKQTLDRGQALLDNMVVRAIKDNANVTGEDGFKMYDTYGFPVELTTEIAKERNIEVDKKAFEAAMKEQKERAKKAQEKINLAEELIYVDLFEKYGKTEFVGYDKPSEDAKVIAILKKSKEADVLHEGEEGEIVLDKTPFYAESGGQVGDTGIIEIKQNDCVVAEAHVFDTVKSSNIFIHKVKIEKGSIKLGDNVFALINKENRKRITAHHSAAHLLQAALRKVVGESVAQAGSYVDDSRLRFDFSFDRAITKEELKEIESLINKWISQNLLQVTRVMDIEEAKHQGAIALFGEKYEDKVRVVSIADVSKELCGGTHVHTTGDIRLIKIVSESAISAGTRRIEAVCSDSAIEYLSAHDSLLNEISSMMKTPAADVVSRVEKLMSDNKDQHKQIKELENELAKYKMSSISEKAVSIEGGKLLCEKVSGVSTDALKSSMEDIASRLKDSVLVLASVVDDKGIVLVRVSDNMQKLGYNASSIVSEIAAECGGKGGGRPNFAQAGIKNTDKIDDAICKFRDKILK